MHFRDFTHDSSFTDYMRVVEKILTRLGKVSDSILDMPAGNGLFADKMRSKGFTVTCGDINQERDDYVHVNMERPLPSETESFDFVTCMEGLEHVINPSSLLAELSRVVKKGGHVVITMPNVQNLYSRLSFLFTGTFYQFDPDFTRHPNGRLIDRGHISPLSYLQINYIFGEYGLKPVIIDGNKWKKKVLLPLYLPLALINIVFYRLKSKNDLVETPYGLMSNPDYLLSRSLIAVWQKQG
ncbi:MAG: class I SAM-dependent methyltransferase [Burkholderiaceae bacterium]